MDLIFELEKHKLLSTKISIMKICGQIRYHPFFLNPDAPKEGILKSEFHRKRFGAQWEPMAANMAQVFFIT